MTCKIDPYPYPTYICFGDCEEIDFRKCTFTSAVERIYMNGDIDCFITDFTCFINLQFFSLRCHKNISELIFPKSLKSLCIGVNQSVIDTVLPNTLDEIIFRNYTCSLIGVTFPERIEKITVSYEILKTIHGVMLPITLTTLEFECPENPNFIAIIPLNFTHVITNYRSITNKLCFSPIMRKLKIMSTAISLNDLPNGIQELIINRVIEDVTNLPASVTKITVKYMLSSDIIRKFKKLPYGCTVENIDGDIILI
ncbi:MAG: hypothetical protein Gaeavirus30_5 [Gaeavirus sp.]|uniref:Uncharacterized protein n=1 Tax=Gaeavirus sp. TaxID=2487767 RepID=A0A3G4ZZG6_9VIRU|nr:MAG: hypothetical protein Gaeavirus30_5 [Gaeavirus sp.]